MRSLLFDLGRDSLRFGLLDDGEILKTAVVPTCEAKGLISAIDLGLEKLAITGDRRAKYQLLLASPGPYKDALYTPHGMGDEWRFDASEIAEATGLRSSIVMHDMLASALSIPELDRDDLIAIHSVDNVRPGPVVVIQTGIGLGVAALIGTKEAPIATLASEGGNASLGALATSPPDAVQMLDHLRKTPGGSDPYRLEPGSVQFALSLSSLPQMFRHLGGEELGAKQVSSRSLIDPSPYRRGLEIYAHLLGVFAANTALTFGAFGGVYILGGAAQMLAQDACAFAREEMRAGFLRVQAQGSGSVISALLDQVPVSIAVDEFAPLRGLSAYAGAING